jgi:hypothetical protein
MTKFASGPQLWRLNQEGRLTVTDEAGEPITYEEAWAVVSELATTRAEAASGKAQH